MERSVFSVSCSLFGGLVLLLGLSGTVTLLPPFYSRQLSSEQPNLSSLGGWLLTPQSKNRHIGSLSITLGCYRFLCKSRHCPIFSTLFVFVSLLSVSICGKCTPWEQSLVLYPGLFLCFICASYFLFHKLLARLLDRALISLSFFAYT